MSEMDVWVRLPCEPPLPTTPSVVGKDRSIVLVAGGESLRGRVTERSPELVRQNTSRAAGGDTHEREVTRAESKTQYGRWVC